MHIEEYVQFAREEIVDAEYIMIELVGLAWGTETHLGLNLNEEPMKGNDVDDQPTPIIELPQAHVMKGALSSFTVEHPLEYFSCRCDKHSIFYG